MPEEKQQLSEVVGIGAVKYADLCQNRVTDYVFNWSKMLAMNGNTIRSARVVLGAVAPIPWRSTDAEQALVGKPLNEATAAAAGESPPAPAG